MVVLQRSKFLLEFPIVGTVNFRCKPCEYKNVGCGTNLSSILCKPTVEIFVQYPVSCLHALQWWDGTL